MNKQSGMFLPLATALAGVGFGYLAKDEIAKHVGYGSYLIPHKYYVGRGMLALDLPLGQTLKHDWSKFTPTEWGPYAEWFNGKTGLQGTKDRETYLTWRKAVQHHYDEPDNLHHWRARHLMPEEVPINYKLESMADWYGVQRAKGMTKKDFKGWFMEKKDGFPIDKSTVDEAQMRLKMAGFERAPISLGAGKEAAKNTLELTARLADNTLNRIKRHPDVIEYSKKLTPQQAHQFVHETAIKSAGFQSKAYSLMEKIIANGSSAVQAAKRRLPFARQGAVSNRFIDTYIRKNNYGRTGVVMKELSTAADTQAALDAHYAAQNSKVTKQLKSKGISDKTSEGK